MSDLNYIDRTQEVKIAGQDATGLGVNFVSADTNGNMLVKDYSDGPVTPGAVAAASALMGGQFNTTLPILTNTQQSAIQLDSSARIISINNYTDITPATQSITALDVGTTSLTGANGQVFYFGTPTTNSAAIFALSSIGTAIIESSLLGSGGTLEVEISTDGGTFWLRPNVFQISTQNYTNSFTAPFIAALNVAGLTHVRVRSTVSWTGTATITIKETLNTRMVTIGDALPTGANVIGGVTQSGSWTVQQGTPPWTVQGDSASGASKGGNPVQIGGVFNTTQPTVTTGQAVEAQSTARGSLIVATGIDNFTIAPLTNTSIVKAQLQDNAGTAITVGQKVMASSVPVVIASDQTGINTFLDKNNSGTIAALNATVVATTNGCSTVSFDVTGTWVATIVIEATTGDGNWFVVNGDVDVTDSISSSFTANTFVTVPCGSFSQVRLRASLYTSGTANINWNSSVGSNVIEVFNTNPASFLTTSRLQDGSGNNINSISNGLNTNTKTALTASSPAAVSIGVASGTAVAANPNRKGLVLTNTSTHTISFGIGVAAVLNSGITLTPGGIWIMDEFNFTVAAINGIASAASSNLAIQEFTT